MGNYNWTREFKERLKIYAIAIIKLYRKIPKSGEGRVIGKQMLRSGTSVAANYRSACRGRSRKEFIAKLGIVIEEADETLFWLELVRDSNIYHGKEIDFLIRETDEILAIISKTRYSTQYPNKKK